MEQAYNLLPALRQGLQRRRQDHRDRGLVRLDDRAPRPCGVRRRSTSRRRRRSRSSSRPEPVPHPNPGWAGETDLDVEYSHAMAPGANILLVETPTSENEGTTGFPQIVEAENYVINHHLGDVISQSFSATEETFPTKQSLLNLRSRVHQRGQARDHRRHGLWRLRSRRRRILRDQLLPAPGDLVAGLGSARHGRRRHASCT